MISRIDKVEVRCLMPLEYKYLPLPQKCLSVAHQIAILWRPPGLLGAPQNSRHKNIFCGAPGLVRHRILKKFKKCKKKYKKFQKNQNMKYPNYLNFFRFFAHFELIPSR